MDKQANRLGPGWKTIIILDACRCDVFKEVLEELNIPSEFDKVDSEAYNTPQWYLKHWNKKTNPRKDVCLVSANVRPFMHETKLSYVGFYDYVQAWDDVEEINPEVTMRYYKYMKNKYPNKKILLHFIPPHLPFIGKNGSKLMRKVKRGWEKNLYAKMEDWGNKHGWDEVREFYKENLLVVMNVILENLKEFPADTFISADHGELIGEQYDGEDRFGHNYEHDLLREVPWYLLK